MANINYRVKTKRCRKALCEKCNKALKWKSLVVHHIDLNRKNNIPSNLMVLCRKCHKTMPFHNCLKPVKNKPICSCNTKYRTELEITLFQLLEEYLKYNSIVIPEIYPTRFVIFFLLNGVGGVSLTDIGISYGVSKERIRQICCKGKRIISSIVSQSNSYV